MSTVYQSECQSIATRSREECLAKAVSPGSLKCTAARHLPPYFSSYPFYTFSVCGDCCCCCGIVSVFVCVKNGNDDNHVVLCLCVDSVYLDDVTQSLY